MRRCENSRHVEDGGGSICWRLQSPLKTKTMTSWLRVMSAIYSGIHEKIIYFETVRFSILFLQMQTLFSERADEALDTRDAGRDTTLHMWNCTLCTEMRWWELFSKSTSWLNAAHLEGRVGQEVEFELQTRTVSLWPRDLGQVVTSSARQGWRSFPRRLKWEHLAVRDSQDLWQWRPFQFLEMLQGRKWLNGSGH